MIKLVHVVWHDSVGKDGWITKDELDAFIREDLHIIDTFGLLIYVNDTFIVTASSFGHCVGDAIKIPIFAIESIEVVREEPIELDGFDEIENVPKLLENNQKEND